MSARGSRTVPEPRAGDESSWTTADEPTDSPARDRGSDDACSDESSENQDGGRTEITRRERGAAGPEGEDTFVLPETTQGDADAPPGAGESPVDPVGEGDRVGPYQLESFLASGGFGEVHRARDPGGSPLAVKILRAELASTKESVARFEREVDAIARVDHPHVIRVFGRGRLEDGRPFFGMELLDGWSLADRIEARGALSLADTTVLLERICDALAAAHEQGIVHRDIKASNVFLAGESERVVLLDFGVAKLLDEGGPGLTRSRQVVGTPACMAPEQLAGETVDRRTDVYALGVLAYHMLTGRRPFSGESAAMLHHLHRNARRPKPSATVSVPPEIDRAVVTAMAVDRHERHADARAFAASLRRATPGAEGAPGTWRSPAVAVAVDVALADPRQAPEDALPELERVLRAAEARLAAADFQPIACAGRTLLAVKPIAAARAIALAQARELVSALASSSTETVRVAARAREGEAELADDRVVGGPVCALPWDAAPPGDPTGEAALTLPH